MGACTTCLLDITLQLSFQAVLDGAFYSTTLFLNIYFISFALVFCLPSNVCIEDIRSPENEVTDSCELSGRC